jgi:hypothetical protein
MNLHHFQGPALTERTTVNDTAIMSKACSPMMEEMPYSSIGNATPEKYAAQAEPQKATPERDLETVKNELAYSKCC